jgi:hypothetical protein
VRATGEKGIISADRARYMAIGVVTQFDLMVRQKDIIGEWGPKSSNRKRAAVMSLIEYGGRMWTGYFIWESIPGWRWWMKTSKSKYRSPAEFLTAYGGYARAGGATEAEEAGADLEAIQSALTHSKKDMTLRYIASVAARSRQ